MPLYILNEKTKQKRANREKECRKAEKSNEKSLTEILSQYPPRCEASVLTAFRTCMYIPQ